MRMKIFGGLMAVAMTMAVGCNKSKDEGDKTPAKPVASTASSAAKMAPAASAPASMAGSAAMMAPAGSGAASGAMAAPGAMSDADFDMIMKTMTALGDIGDKDKGNCDKMADDIGKYADDNKDSVAKMQGMKDAKPSPEQMQKMMAVMPKMMALDACKTNPKMQALKSKFGGM